MELVGVNDAARALGVHPSQITRGIQRGLIPNRAPPGTTRPMVNVAEAREARERGLDRSKQRGPSSPLFEVVAPAAGAAVAAMAACAPAAIPTPAPAPAHTAPIAAAWTADDDARDPSYQASRARRESAAAAKAEIELAQLRGTTLDRAEVADAAFRLGQMLREGMEARRVALAQRLVGLEMQAMISVLADADEAHLAALADAVERELAPEEAHIAA